MFLQTKYWNSYPSGSSLGSKGMAWVMPEASVTVGPEPPRSLEIREMTICPRTVSVSSEVWRCRSSRWTETDTQGTLMRLRNLITAIFRLPGTEEVEISRTIHALLWQPTGWLPLEKKLSVCVLVKKPVKQIICFCLGTFSHLRIWLVVYKPCQLHLRCWWFLFFYNKQEMELSTLVEAIAVWNPVTTLQMQDMIIFWVLRQICYHYFSLSL